MKALGEYAFNKSADDWSQMPDLCSQWARGLGDSWESLCILWYTLLEVKVRKM